MTTLARIRDLFRDITATTTYQLTDSQVDQIINDYYTLDMAERLQLFSLKTEYVFNTVPYQADYPLLDADPTLSVLNRFTSFENPVYFGGYRGTYFQDEAEFRQNFSESQFLGSKASGDGVVAAFSFSLTSINVLPNRVIIQTQDSSGNAQVLKDDGSGTLVGDGTGSVNYVTSAVSVTFSSIPANGQSIDAQWVEVRPARPVALLYFDNKFTIRPVPDTVYEVRLKAFRYLTQLLTDAAVPELSSWWRLIAFGAALQYFESRRDMQSYAEYQPVYQEYEDQALYRTARQVGTQTRKTIYDGNSSVNRNMIYYPYNG